ncbi:hypothetical protein AUF78_15465 [archaeon 13_1_20CM_2_51_12]|nr:MAG: hypothetical protein AUF78_15465 [archaeon 13_1_20CM_2_51_12]
MDPGAFSGPGQLEEGWGGNRSPVTVQYFAQSLRMQTLHASLACCFLPRLHLTINNFARY